MAEVPSGNAPDQDGMRAKLPVGRMNEAIDTMSEPVETLRPDPVAIRTHQGDVNRKGRCGGWSGGGQHRPRRPQGRGRARPACGVAVMRIVTPASGKPCPETPDAARGSASPSIAHLPTGGP